MAPISAAGAPAAAESLLAPASVRWPSEPRTKTRWGGLFYRDIVKKSESNSKEKEVSDMVDVKM